MQSAHASLLGTQQGEWQRVDLEGQAEVSSTVMIPLAVHKGSPNNRRMRVLGYVGGTFEQCFLRAGNLSLNLGTPKLQNLEDVTMGCRYPP